MITAVIIPALLGAAIAGAEPPQPLFRVAEATGLPDRGATFGGTWCDLDADGLRDLVLSRHGDADVEFYRNNGDLSFSLVDLTARPVGMLDHHGTAACDHDADGHWDLFLSAGADRGEGESCKQLWCHDGSFGFVSTVDCDHLLADPAGRGRGALWLQVAPCDLPALLLLNFDSPSRLFGRRDGQWVDWTERLRWSPVAASDSSATAAGWLVAVTADFDGDGSADLLTGGSGRRLWHNTDGWFDLVTDSGLSSTGPPLADAAAGDIDGDGDLDLVLLHGGGGMRVLRNESLPGQLRFSQPVPQSTSGQLHPSPSCALADLDNDGRLDLAIARRGRRGSGRVPKVLLGAGDGTFHAPAGPTGLGTSASRAMALWSVDCDGDGDLDLVALNGLEVERDRVGAVVVYENLAVRRGVTLELEPAAGAPPHGLGAVVSLETGGVAQHRQVRCVANPWNATVPALHFGVGNDPGPFSVTIYWPSGRQQVVQLPVPGMAYRIIEREAEPRRLGASP